MIRQTDLGGALAALVLLVAVALAPLAFGGVLPREQALIDAAALLALALIVAGRHDPGELRAAAMPALALAAVGIWGLLQSLPWPRPLVGLLAPNMVGTWSGTAAMLGEPESAAVPLSLAPEVSRSVGFHWLAMAAAVAAAGSFGADRRWRRMLALGLLAATVFEIVYGADQWFERSTTIWGVEVGGEGRLRGTFVNPDHFAMFLLMPLAAAFAWGWWSMRRVFTAASLERRLLYLTLPWLFFLLIFVGLAFTGSRGAMAGAAVVLLVQAVFLALHYRRWQAGLLGAGAVLVGFVGVGYFGFQRGLARWLGTSAYELTWNLRYELYRSGFELWKLFPVTGTGLGTFRQAFPRVQPAHLTQTWIHAHSDALELLITTGPVPLLLLGAATWGLFRILRQRFNLGRRSEDRGAALAAAGALAGVLAHSLVDFGLTMPANALALAVILGLGCGSPIRRPKTPSDRPEEPRQAGEVRTSRDEPPRRRGGRPGRGRRGRRARAPEPGP